MSILTSPFDTLGMALSKSLGRLDLSAFVLTLRHLGNTDTQEHAVLHGEGMPFEDVLHNLQLSQKPSELLVLDMMSCVVLINETFIKQVSDQPP